MAQKFVEQQINDNKVMVFSKTYCPYCNMAKKALKDVEAQFSVVELDKRRDGDEIQDVLLKLTGARSVPRVFIKGKCIGGGTETKTMAQSGKLKTLVKE